MQSQWKQLSCSLVFSLYAVFVISGVNTHAAIEIDPTSNGYTKVFDDWETGSPTLLSGTLSSPFTTSGNLGVATVGTSPQGNGAILIDAGSDLTVSGFAVIGTGGGYKGRVTVESGGATLRVVDHIIVADSGSGDSYLHVNSGASAQASFLSIGPNGRVEINGTGELMLDETPGISFGQISNGNTHVGHSGTGSMTVNSGSFWTEDQLYIGRYNGSNGTVDVENGGELRAGENIYVDAGNGGTGTLDVNSGGIAQAKNIVINENGSVTVGATGLLFASSTYYPTFAQPGDTIVGDANSTGSLMVNGGSFSTANNLLLADGNGVGTLDVIDGTIMVGNELNVADGGTGEMTIQGDSTVTAVGIVYVGFGFGTAVATLSQSGGELNADDLIVGYVADTATFNITAGQVSAADDFVVGDHTSQAVVNQSGGTIHVGDDLLFYGPDESWLSSHYNFDGGTVNVTSRLQVGRLKPGTEHYGAAIMTVSSGQINVGELLQVDGSGQLTLSGGEISAQSFEDDTYSTYSESAFVHDSGTFIIDGGTFDNGGRHYNIGTSSGSSSFQLLDGASTLPLSSATIGPGGAGTFEIHDTSSAIITGTTTLAGSDDTLTIDGGSLTTGSLDNSNGGTLNHLDGTLTIDGGTFDNGSANLVVGSTLGSPLMRFENGASTPSTVAGIQIANVAGEMGILEVTGNGSHIDSIGNLIISSLGSSGTVTVSDSAQLDIASYLLIGGNGQGNMSISSNGIVNVSNILQIEQYTGGTSQLTIETGGILNLDSGLIIANGSNSQGSVVVQNPGTQINMNGSGDLTIGSASTGSFTIDDGAAVSVGGSVYVGRYDGADGSLTMSAGGTLVGSSGAEIGSGAGRMGDVSVTGGGSSWDVGGTLNVGGSTSGTGTLSIDGGGNVTSTASYVSGIGTVTVDGSSSTWTNTGLLSVGAGFMATGTLDITDGGTVSNTDSRIAENTGSVGTVTVDGTNSTWTNSGSLYLGGNAFANIGSGTLNVSNNGEVNVTGTTKIWSSDDLLWINGGSLTTGSLDNTNGGSLTINGGLLTTNSLNTNGGNFNHNGGTVTIDGGAFDNGSTDLIVASSTGYPLMSFENGATIQKSEVSIGNGAGESGNLQVIGSGSEVESLGGMSIGANGTGSLSISNGGFVNVAGSTILGGADDQLAINGGSLTTGSLLANDGLLDLLEGTVTIDGGTFNNGSGPLRLGSSTGTSTIRLLNNATLQEPTMRIGHHALQTGIVEVVGSTLDTGPLGSLRVGVGGNGTLDVSSGGFVPLIGASLEIGWGGSGVGEVNLTGTSQILGLGGASITVGGQGQGTLYISDGSFVDSDGESSIGESPSGMGEVTVDGAGSRWSTGSLHVGGTVLANSGQGTLIIQNGGTVSALTTTIVNSDDTVVLDGGTLSTETFNDTNGGTFDFLGGRLEFENFNGNLLVPDGGTIANVNSPGTMTMNGTFEQMPLSSLEIELGGTSTGEYDILVNASGVAANLAGNLSVSLSNGYLPTAGDVFYIVIAPVGFSGSFDTLNLPALNGSLFWDISYGFADVTLSVNTPYTADFDGDGDVDDDDLTDPVLGWEARFGVDLDGFDFLAWQREYTGDLSPPLAAAVATPEPSSMVVLSMLALCNLVPRRRRVAV